MSRNPWSKQIARAKLRKKRKEQRLAVCQSGKVGYSTRSSAIFFAKSIYGNQRAYECPHCQRWHLATRKRR